MGYLFFNSEGLGFTQNPEKGSLFSTPPTEEDIKEMVFIDSDQEANITEDLGDGLYEHNLLPDLKSVMVMLEEVAEIPISSIKFIPVKYALDAAVPVTEIEEIYFTCSLKY